MAKNITQKDIEYLDGAVATSTYGKNHQGFVKHGEYGSARFERIKELGLIELAKIEGTDKFGYRPTVKGAELIAPMVAKREQADAKYKSDLQDSWDRQEALDAAFKAELQAIGVTMFERSRASKEWSRDGDYMEYSVDFPITCRIEYDRRENRYFVRAAVGHSGECDPDALSAEAQQAKVARDYLNSKLAGERGNGEVGE